MTKHWTNFITASLATLLIACATAPFARADISQWEYSNHLNLGKQPSTTLCVDGAGVNAVPGADLSLRNLTRAFLVTDLTGANFTQANLTDATFEVGRGIWSSVPAATLTGANFSHANLTNADFGGYVGFDPNDPGSYYYLGADLTGASLVQANLTGANFVTATLANADLSHTKLNANFRSATLTGANLTGADVRGASFYRASVVYFPYYDTLFGGITLAQLYSTASYQAHDLTEIGLNGNDLTGGNFVGQNLTNAWLSGAKLTGADLTGAEVRGADFNRVYLSIGDVGGLTLTQLYSTASYLAHDLNGIGLAKNDLTGGNFIGQNLTNASFNSATLTDANLTGAEVRGANFSRLGDYGSVYGSGITVAQLHSTASHQAHDLSGIKLGFNNLAGVNLAGQNLNNADFASATLTNADFSQANLTNAYFSSFYHSTAANLTGANLSQANLTNADFSAGHDYYDHYAGANLTGANLSQANLTNADFSGFSYSAYDEWGEYLGEEILPGGNLTGANLSGADARGANFQFATLTGMNTSNLIQSDGHMAGLDLTAGKSSVVRDYDGNPAATSGPFPIVVEEHLSTDGTGTLRLIFDADAWDSTISFAPGIPVALGGTLELAFAPGVDVATQSGRTIDLFDWTGVTPTGAFIVASPYTWDLSQLYTTGQISLGTTLAGDYSGNGTVGPEDYGLWKSSFGSTTLLVTDGNGDGIVNAADYTVWRNSLGTSLAAGGSAALPSLAVPEPATITLVILTTGSWSLRRRQAASRVPSTH